jgi:hypothetical protein
LIDGVYKCNYNLKSPLEKIGEGVPSNNEFGAAWIDSATNRIRISNYISYTEFNNEQKKKYAELRAKTDYLPSWGDSGIAYISELGVGEKWTVINSAATKTAADLTPGLNALDKNFIHNKQGILSCQSIIMNSTCRQMVSKTDIIRYVDTTEYKKFGIDRKNIPDGAELKLIKINSNFDLIVTVFWGEADSPHFCTPVYVVDKNENITEKLKGISFIQAGIQVCTDYVLFASEYENTFPEIFDSKTFDIIWSKSSAEKAIIIGN